MQGTHAYTMPIIMPNTYADAIETGSSHDGYCGNTHS